MTTSVEVVVVGSEIVRGAVAETNSGHLARSLAAVGLAPSRIVLLPDEIGPIERELRAAIERGAVVIVTGGLGPTVDDVTKEAAIRALGGRTEVRGEIVDRLSGRFAERGVPMPDAYRDQARVPAGASVLPNTVGSAVGLRVRGETFDLYLLPGVPEEMREIFARSVLPELPAGRAESIVRIRTFGLNESAVEERIRGAVRSEEARRLSITATPAGVDLYLPAAPGDGRIADAARAAFGSYCFAVGDESMEQVVIDLLRRSTATLATAESVTGGLIASTVVSVSGASEVFLEGFVAYGNEAKVLRLGVDRGLLESRGAVSADMCVAMARGARERSGSDLAVATTGIAGPGGGSAEKPVGLVFVSLAAKRSIYCRRLRLSGARETIRRRAAYDALDLLRLFLVGERARIEPHLVAEDPEGGRP